MIWRQSSIGMNDRGRSVVSSLKLLRRDYNINNPRDCPPVADGVGPLILGPPDQLSD